MAVDVVVMVVVLVLRVGFVAQPALHIEALGRRVVQTGVEQRVGMDCAELRPDDGGARVERPQAAFQRVQRIVLGEIALGDDDAVGHCGLLHRLPVAIELNIPVDPVDSRYHAVEREPIGDHAIGHQRVDDRRRVGEPGGFDHDAGERRHLALDPLDEELAQRAGEIAADRCSRGSRR